MPRLHVWLIGAATLTATSYASYSYIYIPRTTSQREFEAKLMMESAELQRVMQSYAQLRATIERAEARAAVWAAGASATVTTNRARTSGSSLSSKPSTAASTSTTEADTIDYELLIAGGGSAMEQGARATEAMAGEASTTSHRAQEDAHEPAARTRSTSPGVSPASTAAAVSAAAGVEGGPCTGVPHRSLPVFRTNQEKLLLYLHIQQIRGMLVRLPRTAQQSEKDLTDMMAALDVYEQTYCCTGSGCVVTGTCTPQLIATVPPEHGLLNFRDVPLTWSQRALSGLCCLLYGLCFRLLPWLLAQCPRSVAGATLMALTAGPRHLFSSAGRREWAVVAGSTARADAVLTYRLHAFYHNTARVMTRLLELEVGMALPENGLAAYGARPRSGAANEPQDADADPTTRYFVMNPSHWMEEVGFWACPQNPLLLPPACLPRESLGGSSALIAHDTVATHTWRVLSAPSTAALANLFDAQSRGWWVGSGLVPSSTTSTPRGSLLEARTWALLLRMMTGMWARPLATAFPVDYGVYWATALAAKERRAAAAMARLREQAVALRGAPDGDRGDGEGEEMERDVVGCAAVATTPYAGTVAHGRSSLGYPLAMDAAALAADTAAGRRAHRDDTDDSTPRFAPVGLAGLPRVLYMDEVVARADSGVRRSRSHLYDYLAAAQYGDEGRGRGGDDQATVTEPGRATAARLTAWQQQRAIPVLSPVWWGGVYGGSAKAGKAARRWLFYQLGPASYPDELAENMLTVTEQAVQAAYA